MKKSWILIGVVFLVSALLYTLQGLYNNDHKFSLDVHQFQKMSLPEQVNYLDEVSRQASIPELKSLIKQAYPNEPNDAHELSHKLGELVIRKYGVEGFGFCDSLLQFGCFHGAALATVRLRGNDPNLASELWEGCRKRAKSPGICLHGLGHAVMMVKQYDLLAAYEECEKVLRGQEDLFWCQDGVSMENIARSMASADLGTYGKEDDIYYPCNSVPKKFEVPCVRNHAGYLYRLWGGDFARTVGFCSSFSDGKTAEECVHLLGSIIVGEYFNNPDKITGQCRIAGLYNRFCIEGAVVNYSMSRQFDRAEKLCNTLEETERKSCFGKIESFLKITE